MYHATLVYVNEESGQTLDVDELKRLDELGIVVSRSVDSAKEDLRRDAHFVVVSVVNNSLNTNSDRFLRMCHQKFVTLHDFQVVVCDDPDIYLQSLLHELGMQNIWPRAGFVDRLCTWIDSQAESVKDPTQNTGLYVKLGVALAMRKLKVLEQEMGPLSEDAKVDFRMAHLFGHVLARKHDRSKAEEAFSSALKLNPYFVPALNALGAAKLTNGKGEEALRLFERLEKINPRNPDRKALMASAYADMNQWDNASEFCERGYELDSHNQGIAEVRARILFREGDVSAGIEQLKKVEVAGEYFISKLNDEAIRLAHDGKFEEAIELYEVAHRLAPPHIKHKISFNVALAYRREGNNEKALQFCTLAEKESPVQPFAKALHLREQMKKDRTAK